MDNPFIVANFKSHMTEFEAKTWLNEFLKHQEEIKNLTHKQVIIAPPFTLLSIFKSMVNMPNVFLAAQNISSFDEGAYTGEINGKQIKEFADFVIIGHSERRNNFGENDEILQEKVSRALALSLRPIYCVQNTDTVIPDNIEIIAYEPVFAIGSGTPDTPENAKQVSSHFLKNKNNLQVLYGGSVNSENVASFTRNDKIRGVLVGGASLNPQEFFKIINNA